MKKLMIMAMVMGIAGAALAAAEARIGYAGQLRNAQGQAITDDLNPKIKFNLYTQDSGGTALWHLTRSVTLNAEGYFNVELKDSETEGNTMDLATVLQTYSTLYIGLTVGTDGSEIVPRQQILHTPYATVADYGSDGFKVTGSATVSKVLTVSNEVNTTTLKANSVQQKTADGGYQDLVPFGVIVMWHGTIKDIPHGWALCDGGTYTNTLGSPVTTPDLRGKFIVGGSTDDMMKDGKNYDSGANYTVKATGGVETVQLKQEEMPSHRHEYTMPIGCWIALSKYLSGHTCQGQTLRAASPCINDFYDGMQELGGECDIDFEVLSHNQKQNSQYVKTENCRLSRVQTRATGGDKAHENRPPYYALAYIMKL